MKIAITGASGFIGTHLTDMFKNNGVQVVPLGRKYFTSEGWHELCQAIDGCDVVINLAGASIGKRWTEAYKRELVESRIRVTYTVVKAINAAVAPPKVFISASAVGYYKSVPSMDEMYAFNDEFKHEAGDDFLAKLCKLWEAEALKCRSDVRTVITRFGIVMSTEEGAMKKILNMQDTIHAATIIGDGKQPFPWISVVDLGRAMEYVIKHPDITGIVNFVAPQAISQRELAMILARGYGVLMAIPLPKFLLKLKLGEGASFLSQGQKVLPTKLVNAGFKYTYPTIESLIKDDVQ